MDLRTLGALRLRRLHPRPRHDDLRQGDGRGGRPRPARRLRRGRRHPRRHRRRLQRRRQRADDRPLARGPARRGRAPDGARDQGPVPDGRDANDVGTSRRHLRRALEDSLRRLGVDHVDLYQVHAWDPVTPLEETLGLPRRRGARGHDRLRRALELRRLAAAAGGRGSPSTAGWRSPVTLQPQYNLLAREIEWEIVPAGGANGLGLLPWSPLGGGWLTGEVRAAPRRPPARPDWGRTLTAGRGLRPPQRLASAPGTSSTPCGASARAGEPRWRRWRWRGSWTVRR